MTKLPAAAAVVALLLAAGAHAQYDYLARGHSAQALAAHITALTEAQFGGGYPQSRRVLAWHYEPVTAHRLGPSPMGAAFRLSEALWRERATGKRRERPTSHYGASMRRVWRAIGRDDFDDAERRLARLAAKTHRHTAIESTTTHEALVEFGDMELARGATERAARSYRMALGMFAHVAPEQTAQALNRLIAAGFRGGDHAGAMDHALLLARMEAGANGQARPPAPPKPPRDAAGAASHPQLAGLPRPAY